LVFQVAPAGSSGSAVNALAAALTIDSTKKATFADQVAAVSLLASSLTSGRVPFASTGGLLVDDPDCAFATDTLTCTKVVASTSATSPLVNATTGFQLNGAATSGNVLRGNGTNFVSTQLSFADLSQAGACTSYSPTIASGSGTLTSASAVGCYTILGKMVHVWIQGTITTNGSGATDVQMSLPFTARSTFNQNLVGHEGGVTGKLLRAAITAGSGTVQVRFQDLSYPGADGHVLSLNGEYAIP
jgi:hypothetical protein